MFRRLLKVSPRQPRAIPTIPGHSPKSKLYSANLMTFFQLPAAEMCAAIDVEDVPSNRRSVVQVHDGIRDVLDCRRLTHGGQARHHVLWGCAVKRRINDP